jgi:hypothetical protein
MKLSAMQTKLPPLLLVLLLFVQTAFCQTPEDLLEKVRKQYTAEKIYIHYDKQHYRAGETIWLKAYVTENGLLTQKSTVCNLDLINDIGVRVDRKILPLIKGVAAGSIDLPGSLPQGSYTVRCYTRRMMNFGTSNYYYNVINIYNSRAESETGINLNQLHAYFFPESGSLIGGVSNVVAFKYTNANGSPVDGQGKIVNAEGKEVATFTTSFNGMGKFEFIPSAGEKYRAICKSDTKSSVETALPDVLYEGSTLNLKRKAGQYFFEIKSTVAGNSLLTPAYILGRLQNKIVYRKKIDPSLKTPAEEIPYTSLPSGILTLTVFNNNNQPLCERLLFVNNTDYLVDGKFTTDTLSFLPRQKNTYTFNSVTDTLNGSYSVSVINADNEFATDGKQESILSRLLLTEDLKGYVYNPGYYLESNDEAHKENADLLMMTNGWRRYKWNEILPDRFPSMAFEDPDYISFSGVAANKESHAGLDNDDLNFIAASEKGRSIQKTFRTNDTGLFVARGLVFNDRTKPFVECKNVRKGNLDLKITSPEIYELMYAPVDSFQKAVFSRIDKNYVSSRPVDFVQGDSQEIRSAVTLQDVTVTAKKETAFTVYKKRYVTGAIGNFPATTMDLLSHPPLNGHTNILEYLKKKVPGLIIAGGPNGYFLNYRFNKSLQGPFIPMDVFIDEIPVTPDAAVSYLADEVAMVLVFNKGLRPGLSGGGAGGALAIYTKRFDGDALPVKSGPDFLQLQGFSVVKEFFSPDYSSEESAGRGRDERTTLYWNPLLKAEGSQKRISFSFYNSDNAKRLKVILEGINGDGKLLHVEKMIE